MVLVSRLGYVTLNVEDMDAAITLFERGGQLQLNDRTPDAAFLGSNGDHHWVELRQDESRAPGLIKMAFELDANATFEEAEKRLAGAGVASTRGSDVAVDHVQEWLRFVDMDGTEVELFRHMVRMAGRPQPRWAKLNRMLHVAVSASDWRSALQFYTEVLGFGVSDYIGDRFAFLHASGGDHHSLVLSNRPGVSPRTASHICFHTDTFDDLMRARAMVKKVGFEVRDDLIRHQTSGSIGFYFEAVPQGMGLEFCFEHGSVVPGNHVPRTFRLTPQAIDVYVPPEGY
jgi:catechol-2,3-dioxygenase